MSTPIFYEQVATNVWLNHPPMVVLYLAWMFYVLIALLVSYAGWTMRFPGPKLPNWIWVLDRHAGIY